MVRKIILLAAIAMIDCQVLAESDDSKDVEEYVVTATAVKTPAAQVSQSVTVVDAKEIEALQQREVSEVLRTVPGVEVVNSGGRGGNVSVFLRGANPEHTLVMIDGVKVNDPSSPNRAFNFANFPVNNIERIEVIRGAESVLYGSDALAGVINIITKSGSGKPRVSVLSEAGSYDSFTERVEAAGGDTDFHASLGVVRQDSGGISAADARFGNSEHDSYGNTSVSLRAGKKIGEAGDLDFSMLYNDSAAEIDNTGGFFGDDPDRRLDTEQLFLQSGFSTAILGGLVNQQYLVSYNDQSRTDNSDPDEISSELLRSRYSGSMFSLEQRNSVPLSESHMLLFGAEWDRERAASHYLSDSDFGAIESNLSGKTAETTGFYLQDQLAYRERLFGTAGLRVDHHSRFGSELTWRIAPAVKLPSSDTKLRAGVGTGFKAPSLVQLYSDFGNPDLKPEESLGVDAGVDQSFLDRRVNTSLTFFWNRFDNLVTFDSETFVLENIAEAETRGVEASADLLLTERLRISPTATYTDTEDKSTGAGLLRRPHFKFTTAAVYDWSENFSSFAEVVFVSDRKDNDFAAYPPATVDLDAYTLLNVGVSYEISPGVELFARADNILDEEYEEVFGFGTLGAAGYGGVRLQF